jgi:hypothetical protein
MAVVFSRLVTDSLCPRFPSVERQTRSTVSSLPFIMRLIRHDRHKVSEVFCVRTEKTVPSTTT